MHIGQDFIVFMYHFGKWEPRGLLLLSFALQLFLLVVGYMRRCTKISTCLSSLLWLAYVGADQVATYALGHLALFKCLNNVEAQELLSFWAPILLLHLGGPDSITAFAIEDNELWKRHLLTLVAQVLPTIYILVKLGLAKSRIFVPAIMILILGILKYGERTCALRAASSSSLRKSMDRRPRYKDGFRGPRPNRAMDTWGNDLSTSVVNDYDWSYNQLVLEAHRLFPNFERLFTGLKLSRDNRDRSRLIFKKMTAEQAFKVVELELSLMYDVLYTKAVVIHTWCGRVLRLFGLLFLPIILGIFAAISKDGYRRADVLVTYALLAGAVMVEYSAFIMALFSTWSYAFFEFWGYRLVADFVLNGPYFCQRKITMGRFDSVGTYNLIDYCLEDAGSWKVCVRRYLRHNQHHAKRIQLDKPLKELIFSVLKEMFERLDDVQKRDFNKKRGENTLDRYDCKNLLQWTKMREFGESILLWHIATDVFFELRRDENAANYRLPEETSNLPESTKKLSDYMLFLLVVKPSMLPIGTGKKNFDNAYQQFFKLRDDVLQSSKVTLCRYLVFYGKYAEKEGVDDEEEIWISAAQLACELDELDNEKRWLVIRGVWVEMLCYAARKCDGPIHAKELSTGGELLTFAWLLTAHLGLGFFF